MAASGMAYAGILELAEPDLTGPQAGAWFDRLEREHDQLDGAMQWCLDHDVERGLRLAWSLRSFWNDRGRIVEGRIWLDRLLSAPAAAARTSARARGLTARGLFAFRQGDVTLARRLEEEALAIARETGDRSAELAASLERGRLALREGDHATAARLGEQGQRLGRELREEGRELFALHVRAEATRLAGDSEGARPLYEESLRRNRQRGNLGMVAVELGNLGQVERDARDLAQAASNIREGLKLAHEERNLYTLAHLLAALATVEVVAGHADEGARLIGAADAVFAGMAMKIDPADRPPLDAAIQRASQELGELRFAAARAEGRTLSADDAVKRVLGATSGER